MAADELRLAADELRLAADDGRSLRPDVFLLAPAAPDPDEARLAGLLEAERDAAAAPFGLAEPPLFDLAEEPVLGSAELLVSGSSEPLAFDFAEDRVLLLEGLEVAIINAPFR